MRFLRALVGRITGRDVRALRAEVAGLRDELQTVSRIVQELNHDIRTGSESSLPLFQGYAERLRLDADTAIGAVQVIERQIALLEQRLGDQSRGA